VSGELTPEMVRVLEWMRENPNTPAAGGRNVDGRACGTWISAQTLIALEKRGLVRGYLGNDGARWYQLSDLSWTEAPYPLVNWRIPPKIGAPSLAVGESITVQTSGGWVYRVERVS